MSIAALAVGLVVVTTLAVAWVAHLTLPGISWSSAFILGAVVSSTDAVAATAVFRRLGIPRRLIALLEGESLLNDASALVLYTAAVTARGQRRVLHSLGTGGFRLRLARRHHGGRRRGVCAPPRVPAHARCREQRGAHRARGLHLLDPGREGGRLGGAGLRGLRPDDAASLPHQRLIGCPGAVRRGVGPFRLLAERFHLRAAGPRMAAARRRPAPGWPDEHRAGHGGRMCRRRAGAPRLAAADDVRGALRAAQPGGSHRSRPAAGCSWRAGPGCVAS